MAYIILFFNITLFITGFTHYIIGLNYKVFFSNIIDPFDKVKNIYSYDPSLTYDYGKKVYEIQYAKKNIDIDPNDKRMLVLGTSGNRVNESEVIKNIITFIAQIKVNDIYYKMHPSMKFDPIYKMKEWNIK